MLSKLVEKGDYVDLKMVRDEQQDGYDYDQLNEFIVRMSYGLAYAIHKNLTWFQKIQDTRASKEEEEADTKLFDEICDKIEKLYIAETEQAQSIWYYMRMFLYPANAFQATKPTVRGIVYRFLVSAIISLRRDEAVREYIDYLSIFAKNSSLEVEYYQFRDSKCIADKQFVQHVTDIVVGNYKVFIPYLCSLLGVKQMSSQIMQLKATLSFVRL